MTSPAELSAVAVLGAGPAGLAAAVHAAEQGASTILIDSAPRLGGQYWRHGKGGPPSDVDVYRDLVRRLDALVAAGRLTVYLHHQVWSVRADGTGCSVAAVDRRDHHRPAEVCLRAAVLVLAVGAFDRPVPFPGWDLPGVLTVGGAQALLKGSGVAVGPRVLVAGTGPFLLPVATALAASGADVLGVYEANRSTGWLRQLPAAAAQPAKLGEAAGYAFQLARHRIPLRTGAVVVAAHGTDRVEAVTVARLDRAGRVRDSTRRRLAVDVVATGYGFTTQSELPLQAGCALHPTPDGTLAVTTDSAQRTSNPRVYAAGETTGIGGAQLAVAEGTVAGISAAGQAGTSPPPEDAVVQGAIRTRNRLRRFATALHAVYPVPPFWLGTLEPDTVVCRCEEVTVAEFDTAIAHGARDARSVKLLSRAGMGWCQGRECAYAVSCLTASRTGQPLDLTSGAGRSVAAPIPLGLVAEQPPGSPELDT
jgi:NADPH-dependent 2,4-dienoyl-CoA reductase/sulfur reductase-like enzyme